MWQNIQGHDAVVEQFRQSLAAGRLASTYLFVGPEGVGKRSLAFELARALLCTGSDEAALDPCGRCESCRLFAGGAHPDLHVVRRQPGDKFLKIEYFIGDKEHRHREGLCFELALKPLVGRRRVAIIDDADWLNVESANSLLKTLEEPPPGAVIILIGTSRSRQLPTILSRSQVVRFAPLPTVALAAMLVEQGVAADAEAARELAARSDGSIARARELADASLWQLRDRLIAQRHAGSIDAIRLAGDVDDMLAAAGKEADVRRQRLRQLFLLTADALRDDLRRLTASDAANDAAGGAPSLDETLAAIDRCLEAEAELDRNANQSTLVECWLDDLIRLADTTTAAGRA